MGHQRQAVRHCLQYNTIQYNLSDAFSSTACVLLRFLFFLAISTLLGKGYSKLVVKPMKCFHCVKLSERTGNVSCHQIRQMAALLCAIDRRASFTVAVTSCYD